MLKQDNNLNVKEKLYNQALGVALSKIQQEAGEVSPQLLTAVVNLLKLDENTLKTTDNSIISNFIKDVITTKETVTNEA